MARHQRYDRVARTGLKANVAMSLSDVAVSAAQDPDDMDATSLRRWLAGTLKNNHVDDYKKLDTSTKSQWYRQAQRLAQMTGKNSAVIISQAKKDLGNVGMSLTQDAEARNTLGKNYAASFGQGHAVKASDNVMSKIEAWAGTKIKPGRNVLKGYPVDIQDHDPTDGFEMDAVDAGVAKDLVKEMRAAGLKAKNVGKLGILVSP